MNSPYEDRGAGFEKIIAQIAPLSVKQKELISEYLKEELGSNAGKEPKKLKIRRAKTSSLKELILLYPNVDFAGFISRDNDKEHYQLWKLIDAFEEVANKIGRKNFDKLHITLIVFGHRITYVSNGSVAINYERFSKNDLVKQLIRTFYSQG
ncbi:MAG: hypothetical protein ABSE68_01440 [Minisyncoccia bacterium]